MQQRGAPLVLAAPLFRAGFCEEAARPYILAAAILASALGFIDGTIVSIALPAIRDDLGASLVQAQWISNAYMLTLSALILVGGAAGDRFGVARVFGGGIVVFIAGSIACAVAPTVETLIAARAAKGVGAAIMIPGSLAVIARAYPREERGRAIGIWSAASALTTAIGPLIGGVALTWGGPDVWRWLFAVNLPLGVIALVLLLPRIRTDQADPSRGLDLPGAVLASVGLGFGAYGLTDTSSLVWTGPVAIAALAAFIWWEATTPHPMVPLALFRNPAFSAANLMTFTLYFALSAVLFFLPMTVIGGWGLPEITATFAFLPLTVFMFLLSSRAGKHADKIGAGPMIALGATIVGIALAVLAITTPLRAFWAATLPSMALMGFGMSLLVAPLSAAVMGAVEDSDTGTASGVNNAVSRIAGLVAVAVMGSVAAGVYAATGGPASFGISSDLAGHARATDRAFLTVAAVTSILAFLSAFIAWKGLPRQTSS